MHPIKITNNAYPSTKISIDIEEYRQWLIEMEVSPDEPYFPKLE